VVRPLAGDSSIARPSLASVVDFVSPAGWTIIISTCQDACNINTCKTVPTSCAVRVNVNPIIDVDETVYINKPNVRIRHDSLQSPVTLRMTQDTWVDQAADNEPFPCSPFVIEAHNVSIHHFQFATEGCVAQLANASAITGQSASRYWATTTPVVVATNVAASTQLAHLQFASTGNVAGLGDAVVRVIPEAEGDVVDLDGAVFNTLTGRVDTTSPVAVAAAVLLPEYTGTITVNSTRVLSMRSDNVPAWMGSVRTPPPPPPPIICKTEDELHRTNTVYIIVVSCLAGVLVIIVLAMTVSHVRKRLRDHHLEKSE
jgi:hypothetical protein